MHTYRNSGNKHLRPFNVVVAMQTRVQYEENPRILVSPIKQDESKEITPVKLDSTKNITHYQIPSSMCCQTGSRLIHKFISCLS